MQFTTNQVIQLLALNFIADNQHSIQFDREKLKDEAEAITSYLEAFEVDETTVDFTEVIRQICHNLINDNAEKETEVAKT